MMHSTAYLEHYADKYMANMLYKHGVSLDQYLADPARYEHLLGAPFPLLPAQTRVRVRLIREDVLQQQAEEIAQALDNLPRSIRDYVGDVPVLVEDFPSAALMANENISPQILGIYIGTPRTEAEAMAQPQDVTRIILFKRNLEKICRDRDDLVEQIQITVRHEIGHHLGLSEEDMERLGLA